MLNAVLLAIPILLWIAIYGVNSLANNVQVDPATGDPVTYQHVVWVEINVSAFAITIVEQLPSIVRGTSRAFSSLGPSVGR